jgi:hypothetical protein
LHRGNPADLSRFETVLAVKAQHGGCIVKTRQIYSVTRLRLLKRQSTAYLLYMDGTGLLLSI